MANEVSKRDLFSFQSKAHADAGRHWWAKSGKQGRLAHSSMDAEAAAPKTWIAWFDSMKSEPLAIVECEIYTVPRASDSNEMVGMLHGMCPKCFETFTVREDNKGMTLDWIEFRRATGHLRSEWNRHCREVLHRAPRNEDKIAVVSSPERWLCDYCKGWCVKVTDCIAVTDMSGATQIIVHGRGGKADDTSKVVPAVAIKEPGVIL